MPDVKLNNPPAYPSVETHPAYDFPQHNLGMSLRDYFAGQAIQGFLSQSHTGPKDWQKKGFGWGEDCANDLNMHQTSTARTLADFAYQVADALLAQRAKGDKE